MKNLVMIMSVFVISCQPVAETEPNTIKSDEGDEAPAAEPSPSVDEAAAGSIAADLSDQNSYPTTIDNVETVSTGMTPGSLQLPGLGLSMNLMGLDVCTGTSGLFDCQPNLVKTYIGLSKIALLVSHALLSAVSEKVRILEPGSSGSIDSTDTGEVNKIEYKIDSETKYQIILHSNKTGSALLKLDVDGTKYVIVSKMRGLGEASNLEVQIDFTSGTDYSVSQSLVGVDCQSADPRVPERVMLEMQKTSSDISGVAMIYMPRGLAESPSCDDAPTDSTKVALYTEYVGDGDQTTASVYMMPTTVDSMSQLASYGTQDFCTNFTGICDGDGKALGDTKVINDDFVNPLCIKALTKTWNGACTGSANAKISTPSYSSTDYWIAPSDLLNVIISVPTSL